MPSGSETIVVVEALASDEEDWEGNPKVDARTQEERSREVSGCLLIPKMNPDDPTIVMDAYQVIMFDTTQTPPAAEDAILLPNHSGVAPDRLWQINGNVGDVRKPSGDIKIFQFVIEEPR